MIMTHNNNDNNYYYYYLNDCENYVFLMIFCNILIKVNCFLFAFLDWKWIFWVLYTKYVVFEKPYNERVNFHDYWLKMVVIQSNNINIKLVVIRLLNQNAPII